MNKARLANLRATTQSISQRAKFLVRITEVLDLLDSDFTMGIFDLFKDAIECDIKLIDKVLAGDFDGAEQDSK
jgi:hypothetical protein